MTLSLISRRTIRASPARLFQAWTDPAQLKQWWGPEGGHCIDAQISPHAGGAYRIDNQLADGTSVVIAGRFLVWDPPHTLRYTWVVAAEPARGAPPEEEVTVRFVERGADLTEVIVVHNRVPTEQIRQSHRAGWDACLSGLRRWAAGEA